MIRLLICISVFFLSACSKQDMAYYQRHPQAVFLALQTCTTEDPKSHVSCHQLETLAQTFRKWVAELQTNPQNFGQKIIKLQVNCARESLSEGEQQNCRQELDMRLAVVKWLESPES